MKFTTRKEVEDYLSGEMIKCLICGKKFRRLARHLSYHETTAREYKHKFGIPLTWGLQGVLTKRKCQESGRLKWERDGAPPDWHPGGRTPNPGLPPLWCLREFRNHPYRPRQPSVTSVSYDDVYANAVDVFRDKRLRWAKGRRRYKIL